MMRHVLRVDPIDAPNRTAVRDILVARWKSPTIVTRARIHSADTLPGFVAFRDDRIVGIITLSVEHRDCEVVTLDALEEDLGVGTILLEHAEDWARSQGSDRMWLVCTNANLRALGFYQRRGFRIMSVHPDAVVRSRELKPEIPDVAENGIPIRDELELEKAL